MEEIKVIYANMPVDTKGMTVRMFDDGEERVTIVLNSRLNWEQNQLSAIHELEHIEAGDFDLEDTDVDTVEWLRHKEM